METSEYQAAWDRARARATKARLRSYRVDAKTFLVKSQTLDGHHEVRIGDDGKIAFCSDPRDKNAPCLGWHGRQKPCIHSACVASRIIREIERRKRKGKAS